MNNNILITSAGRRVSLVKAFQKELKKLNIKGGVYSTDLNPELSSACLVSDGYFKVPKVTNHDYINELLGISIKNNIKVIIPTIDTELKKLSLNHKLFKEKGIEIIISDESFVSKCRDKREIHKFFDENGFPRAKDVKPTKFNLPIFVKPTDGSRSVGIYLVRNESELTNEILSNPKNMFLEYIDINENNEFTIDIYFNKNSKIISIVPRERILVRDGEVNKACTRKNLIVPFIKDKFSNLKGLKGCITLQVFKNKKNDNIIGIEINPRFGGGYPLSYEAGANFPKWIIKEYILNESIEEYFDLWSDNTLMLRYDAEVISYGFKG